MAVSRGSDRLSKALSGINTDHRFTTWLWFYLNNLIPSSNLGDFGSFSMRDRMAEAITNNPLVKQRIEIDRAAFFLPKESLNWIKNDKRQRHWITRKIAERNGLRYITGITSLTDRDLAIATIDIWNIPFSDKLSTVTEIASEWDAQEKSDKIFDWFYGPDERAKLELSWEMATKNHQLLTACQTPWQETADMIIAMEPPSYPSQTRSFSLTQSKNAGARTNIAPIQQERSSATSS